MQQQGEKGIFLTNIIKELEAIEDVEVAHSFKAARKALRVVRGDNRVDTSALKNWLEVSTKLIKKDVDTAHTCIVKILQTILLIL